MAVKSDSGKILVYVVQPELADTYDTKMLEIRLSEPNEIEDTKEEEIKGDKPKRRMGRFVIFPAKLVFDMLLSHRE